LRHQFLVDHIQKSCQCLHFFLIKSVSYNYMDVVMQRIADRFDEEEMKTLARLLNVIDKELMPEIDVELRS
nr:hypothetical protein [Lachnospiraceae bacterium]